VRFGGRRSIEPGTSQLKQGSDIVTDPPRLRRRLGPGDVAFTIDERPAFIMPGSISMHRDLQRGSRGADVHQLEVALTGLGFSPGAVDGVFDRGTQGAVAAFYASKGYEPFGPTDTQLEQLRTAEADAAVARDAYLQAVNTVEQTGRPTTPGEVEQARIDLTTARDLLHTAQLAVPTARTRLASARTLAATAATGAGETLAATTAQREQAAADVEVALKQEALAAAVEEARLAVLDRNAVPVDAPINERERATAAVNAANQAIVRAQAELNAAIAVADSIRASTPHTVQQARDEAANLVRDADLAAAELRRAERGVRIARRQVRLSRLRVRALTRPVDTSTLRAITGAARDEARRTRAFVNQLAARSGVQVPANELVFLPDLPVRVDEVKSRRGTTLSGPVMTVTSSRLIVDSSLGVSDAKLVRVGDRVVVDEQDLGVRVRGRVAEIDRTPGTRKVEPSRFYFSVVPSTRAVSLVGASVRLTIAVTSTRGAVLAVPVSAVSVGGDGSSRLQVRRGGQTELVRVRPGLAAEGYVEVRPVAGERLRRGELVIVGAGAAAPPGAGP
jgi:peptidoglycan hydrolase-like protein with peptidoglycan-binding domain